MSEKLRFKFLGATGEVERASILLSVNGNNLLLDYGIKLSKPPLFPLHVAPRDLDGIIVSHSHIDHIGGLPLLYVSGEMPIYMTPPSLSISDLLIKDFLKISGPLLPYEYFDFQTLMSKTILVNYDEEFRVGETQIRAKMINAGHIPGSAQILIETDSMRILYTGDINYIDTHLLNAMEKEYGEVDIVITESTYGAEEHPNRKDLERKFVESVTEVVENKGVALIPAFAVGRSQEILMILVENGFKHKICIDGMAVEATKIILEHPEYLRDAKKLQRAFRKAEIIERWRQRKSIIKEPCAIIAPAGMLGGGAAVFYLTKLYDDEKNGIFIVGFQVPGTPGRMLLEERKAIIKGKVKRVKMRAEKYHFSSHIDKSGFKSLFSKIKGDPKFFVIHGNKENSNLLAKMLKEDLGFDTYLPKLGEEFEVDSHSVIRRGRTSI